MLGPAGDMDLRSLAPHRAAHVGAMADAMRLAEQRQLGAVDERPARRQAFQPGGDPAGLRLGKAHGGGAGHAQRRRQHDAPAAPDRPAARRGGRAGCARR